MDHRGNSPTERDAMLKYLGIGSEGQLYDHVNEKMLLHRELAVDGGLSEIDLTRMMRELAATNRPVTRFLGAGMYKHFVPAAVRHVTGLPQFSTSYTPYQAEASQGVLQALYEYQTMICRLTGMDVSNAGLYDGSTALAEACLMAKRISRKSQVIIPDNLHPEYVKVLSTYLASCMMSATIMKTTGGVIDEGILGNKITDDTACVIVQNPNFTGCIEDTERIADIVHDNSCLQVACVNDATSLGLIKPPKDSDIVVGEGQSLGNDVAFGGPHFGFMATRKEYVRKMPGRLVGGTVDDRGQRGYVLTIQSREQHIRREKATSNICTSESLNAIAATAYLSLLGPHGLRDVALASHHNTCYLRDRLLSIKGFTQVYDKPFYNEVLIRGPEGVDTGAGYDLSRVDGSLRGEVLYCCTELDTKERIDEFIREVKAR
ncbi:aminomethyl-transferring glycine dehydrogenase subunit GcvPA [Candidatus Altiarchaeota archaeon]